MYSPFNRSDGAQCTVDHNISKRSHGIVPSIQVPLNRDAAANVHRDTPTYSPAFQFKKNNEERKRKESVQNAMREISDLLSPVDESPQLDSLLHAYTTSASNTMGSGEYEFNRAGDEVHRGDAGVDDMIVELEAPSDDPLLSLCEAVGKKLEQEREQDSAAWEQLPHSGLRQNSQEWELFGGEVRLSVPTPMPSSTSSLSFPSNRVSPAPTTYQWNGSNDGAPAGESVPRSHSPVEQNDSRTGNGHMSSMFPGLLQPNTITSNMMGGQRRDGALAIDEEHSRSDVFSERGETLDALCNFLFSP